MFEKKKEITMLQFSLNVKILHFGDDKDGRNSWVSISGATSYLFPSIIFIKM